MRQAFENLHDWCCRVSICTIFLDFQNCEKRGDRYRKYFQEMAPKGRCLISVSSYFHFLALLRLRNEPTI
jgi:hypothetical protein